MTYTETTFGPKTYLAIKKTIPVSEVSNKNMYDEAGQKLGAYMQSHDLTPSGPWTVIYFTWDMQSTSMAIAFPIDDLESVDDEEFSVVTIPENKALLHEFTESYDKLGDAHMAIANELTKRSYTYSSDAVAIEEYIIDQMQDTNPANWKTNIYHLYM